MAHNMPQAWNEKAAPRRKQSYSLVEERLQAFRVLRSCIVPCADIGRKLPIMVDIRRKLREHKLPTMRLLVRDAVKSANGTLRPSGTIRIS